MNPTAIFLAVRAIGSAFATKLWTTILVWVGVVAVLLLALQTWLVSLSQWWWLLAMPVIVVLSVVAAVLTIFYLLIRYIRPEQTPHQRKQVKKFVGKLEFVTEITSTPKLVILFRTIRSMAAPKSDQYLQEMFETKDLKKDFTEIVKTFKK